MRYLTTLFLSLFFVNAFAAHHGDLDHETTMHVVHAWIKEPLPGMTTSAAYLMIHNHGADTDRLIGVRTNIAEFNEIHDMKIEDGVMKMRAITNGLEIGPDERVVFKPGGLHIMLFNLTEELVDGTARVVTLEFEKAGKVDVPALVKKVSGQTEHRH